MARIVRACEVVEGGEPCPRPHWARGMCRYHHRKWYRQNKGTFTVRRRSNATSVAEAFWFYVRPGEEPEDCWEWAGPTDGREYPLFKFNFQKYRGHVFACALLNGPRPDGLSALHKCGPNPWCVNPNHLAWGDDRENSEDKVFDGTSSRGVRNGRAKLSEADVLAIYADTRPKEEIARQYGVHSATVRDIKRARIWAWLTQDR